jgi:glycosyltransferase involved in cell wall biosynthesis
MQKKPRLAIIGVGIIGNDNHKNGIPAFVQAIGQISLHYSVTVYSFIPIAQRYAPAGVRVRSVANMHIRLQYVLMFLIFGWDHFRYQYSVIHAQSPFPAGVLSSFLSRIYRVPWLLSFHAGEAAAMPEIGFGDLLREPLKSISKRVTHNADLVMAFSEMQARDIERNLQFPIANVKVLPRGIVVSPFQKKELTAPICFIHISNYQPIKDIDMLLDTYQVLSQSIPGKLLIVGKNHEIETFEKIKERHLQDSVFIVGGIDHRELSIVMRNAHIMLHTSRYEGLPMVALEAMASSVVVCGTHVGVMADLSGRCCVTVEPGDYVGLAQRVQEIIRNPAAYYTLQRQAYDWIKAHDMDWYIRELMQCYKTITDRT